MILISATLKRSVRRFFRIVSRGWIASLLSLIAFGLVMAIVGYVMIAKIDINFGVMSVFGYVFILTCLIIGLIFGVTAMATLYRKVQPTWRKPNRYCLDLLLPPGAAEHRIAALQEEYNKWKQVHKLRRARKLYFWQSLGTIVHYWFERLLKKTKLINLIDSLVGKIK